MKKVNFIKNFSLKSELAETIALCLIFYMVLACFALCIGLGLTSYFDTLESDKPSVISNMFVWSATLIAPVIVILLINSWKNQKNYDLKKEYASNILNDLHLNFIEILTHKEFVLILNGIDRRLKINKSYTSKPQHILGDVTLRSFSSFKIFGNLFNNDLLNLYTSLEKHCFQIDMAISSLRKFYIEYLETFEKNYKNDELINKDFFTSSYKFENDYADFRSSITLINHQLKEHKVIEYDALTCEPVTIYGEYATLYEMLEATIDIIVTIQDLCIEALDLDNQ